MNNDRLEAIRARCEAATPGPWASEYCPYPEEMAYRIGNAEYVLGKHIWKENADFIAYARADIPFLLAEVERLADALKAKEAVNQAYSAAVDLMDDARRELHEKLVLVAASRDRWEQAAESQNNRIDVLESDAAMHRHHAEIVTADRDRWKARAEALERAIKSSETNDRNSLLPPCCSTCAHCNRNYESLVDCAKKCKRGSSWEFDEARFTTEKEP